MSTWMVACAVILLAVIITGLEHRRPAGRRLTSAHPGSRANRHATEWDQSPAGGRIAPTPPPPRGAGAPWPPRVTACRPVTATCWIPALGNAEHLKRAWEDDTGTFTALISKDTP